MSFIQQQEQENSNEPGDNMSAESYEEHRAVQINNSLQVSKEELQTTEPEEDTRNGSTSSGLGLQMDIHEDNDKTQDNDHIEANDMNQQETTNNGGESDESKNMDLRRQSVFEARRANSYKYPVLKKYFEFGPWVGRNRNTQCRGCGHQSCSSQPDRLLKHLRKCDAISENDKCIAEELISKRDDKKPTNSRMRIPRTQGAKFRPSNHDEDFGPLPRPTPFFDQDELDSFTDHSAANMTASTLSLPSAKKSKHMDRRDLINQALTRFIMVWRIPLKSIHSKEFKDLVHSLDPNFHLPSRETITTNLIPGMLNIL